MLGEIDYLLGEHARAREVLLEASQRCDAVSRHARRRAVLHPPRDDRDRGRRLPSRARSPHPRAPVVRRASAIGSASRSATSCSGTPITAPARWTPRARARSPRARRSASCMNPRGEAACERLLALIAIDTDDFAAGGAHASVAAKIFERLQDPWGDLEARLLLAQVALAKGDPQAKQLCVGVREDRPRRGRAAPAPPPHARLARADRGALAGRRDRDRPGARGLRRQGPLRRPHPAAPQAPRRDELGAAGRGGKVEAWLDLVENANPDESVSSRWPVSPSRRAGATATLDGHARGPEHRAFC